MLKLCTLPQEVLNMFKSSIVHAEKICCVSKTKEGASIYRDCATITISLHCYPAITMFSSQIKYSSFIVSYISTINSLKVLYQKLKCLFEITLYITLSEQDIKVKNLII